MGVAWT